jgi:outer membrane protein OmpA-like peptidoglycan-associated protein
MFSRFFVLSISIVLIIACSASILPNLVRARAAYQLASQGRAARLTPAQLHVAQSSLVVAEKMYSDEGDTDNVRDRAYVAQRKAELAEVQASIVEAQAREVAARQQLQRSNAQKLNDAQAELAGSRDLIATQQDQLASEKQRRQEAEKRAAEAMAQLANIASIKQESRGTVITLSGAVIFASGKAELLPSAQEKLSQVAEVLKKSDPDSKFLVEGFTDSRGSDALNQDLSTRRAAAVRAFLVSRGVPETRITSQGFGKNNPMADNDSAEGRANNRRVEIVVQSPGQETSHGIRDQTQSQADRAASEGVNRPSGNPRESGSTRQ